MRAAIAIVLVIVAMTGCAAEPTDSAGATPSSEASTPVPTPTTDSSKSPEVASPPSLSDLVVSPDGIGPIVFGSPVGAAADPSVVYWDETWCDYDAETIASGATDSPGWKASYPDSPFLVYVDTADAQKPVNWIMIRSTELTTDEGFGVGSSMQEVQAAYGSALTEIPDFNRGLSLSGTNGQLVFWADGNVPDTVIFMTIQMVTEQPYFPLGVPCS